MSKVRLAKKVLSDHDDVYKLTDEMEEEEALEEYNRLRQVGWPVSSLELIEIQDIDHYRSDNLEDND